jgi:hypothetical protein
MQQNALAFWTHVVRPEGVRIDLREIRSETGNAGRQTPKARQRSCRSINHAPAADCYRADPLWAGPYLIRLAQLTWSCEAVLLKKSSRSM